jgi:hypothetical protein
MRNRTKVMLLIMLFWIVVETVLLLIGFSPLPVLMFIMLGIIISNLIGMCLDIHNEKVNRWFDSTELMRRL